MAATASHRFSAHARDEGRHRSHPVPGAVSLQDAALTFAEHWTPAGDAREVSIIVHDHDSGEQQCFHVEIDTGEAEPCR